MWWERHLGINARVSGSQDLEFRQKDSLPWMWNRAVCRKWPWVKAQEKRLLQLTLRWNCCRIFNPYVDVYMGGVLSLDVLSRLPSLKTELLLKNIWDYHQWKAFKRRYPNRCCLLWDLWSGPYRSPNSSSARSPVGLQDKTPDYSLAIGVETRVVCWKVQGAECNSWWNRREER